MGSILQSQPGVGSQPQSKEEQGPQYEVVPALVTDCPEMVDVFSAAFAEDPLFIHFQPAGAVSPADLVILRQRNIQRYEAAFKKEEMRYFKVVDRWDGGKIAAFARWWFPHVKSPERLLADEQEALKPKDPPIPGVNAAFEDEFFQQMLANRKKYIVDADMYFLSILAVHPAHQRRGLGSMLMKPVLAMADAEGRKTYIEATKKGLPLYERHGWVRIDEIVMDPRPFGAKQTETTVLLMRDPKPIPTVVVEKA